MKDANEPLLHRSELLNQPNEIKSGEHALRAFAYTLSQGQVHDGARKLPPLKP